MNPPTLRPAHIVRKGTIWVPLFYWYYGGYEFGPHFFRGSAVDACARFIALPTGERQKLLKQHKERMKSAA